jgi:tetratricopeptide (TPR) repeat protein
MFRFKTVVCTLALALLAPGSAQAKGKPEAWLEVRSPHFRVATNGSEKDARRVADQFERMRAVFQLVFPALRVDPASPIVVLAARNKKSFESLLPPSMLMKGAAPLAGLFQSGPEKNYVLLRLDATGKNPYHTLRHEYTHVLLAQSPVALPPWLDEGLAEYYGNSEIEQKVVKLGKPNRSHVQLLLRTRLLPLRQLFAVTHSSPYYNEDNKVTLFYAESWALVHMLVAESLSQKRNPLAEYLNNLQLNLDPQAAALRAFGDPKALQDRLQEYIHRFGFRFFYIKSQIQVDDGAFTERALAPVEADALQGDCMVYTGNYEGARRTLAKALEGNPKNAEAAESMGYLELQQKHMDEAKKWFRQAIQFKSKSYLAHYYYALMRMKESPRAGLNDDVGDSLNKAIAINPDFAPAYNALAQFYANRDENLEEAHQMALHAVTLEPSNVYYYLTTASVLMRMKQAANAVRVCKKAVGLAKRPNEITAAENMLASAERFKELMERVEQHNAQVAAANARRVSGGTTRSEGPSSGGEIEPRPELRRRDGIPVDGPQGFVAGKPIPFQSDPARRGARDTLTGVIQNVQCSLPAVMKITFVAGKRTFELFSENYFDVSYMALSSTPTGTLYPCRDLKGYKARVYFYDLKGKRNAGELIWVQVWK